MDEIEKRIRIRLRDDYKHYASKCLSIRTKQGAVEKFNFNAVQDYVHEKIENQRRATGMVRVITLKGRQQGLSTYISGRLYHGVTHRKGCRAFIMTHDSDATNNLFQMTERYHDNCPVIVKPLADKSNAKELSFGGLDSGYKIGTAGNKTVGRSHTVQLLHCSEVAFWKNATDHAKGILQAVPYSPGTEIYFESTANGTGNYFHEQWQLAEAGLSDFMPIFVPWFWSKEYQRPIPDNFQVLEDEYNLINFYGIKPAQLMWRRYKIIELSAGGSDGRKAFMQEYPCTPVEAFQVTGENGFISPDLVMHARKFKVVDPYGPLLIGVDPARMGPDRFSIIRRKGRVAYKLQSYKKKTTTEAAHILHRIIIEEEPEKMFIDTGGLGAGVFDRLVELGHEDVVVDVDASSTPLNQKKYSNKRAEMWGLCKEWLESLNVEIPDSDSLHADLCSIQYMQDVHDNLKMESSESMRKRGIRSPDEGSALIQTFAYPVERRHKKSHKDAIKAKRVLGKSTHELKMRELWNT